MTLREACNLTYDLESAAARCTCDIDGRYPWGGVCPQCECLGWLAQAIGEYVMRCELHRNRAARRAID